MIWSVQVTVWLTAQEGLQVHWLSGVTNIHVQRNNSKLRYVILRLLLQIVHFVRKRNLSYKKFSDAVLSSIWYIDMINECKIQCCFQSESNPLSLLLSLSEPETYEPLKFSPESSRSSEILFDYKLKSLFSSFSSSIASEATCCSIALVLGRFIQWRLSHPSEQVWPFFRQPYMHLLHGCHLSMVNRPHFV